MGFLVFGPVDARATMQAMYGISQLQSPPACPVTPYPYAEGAKEQQSPLVERKVQALTQTLEDIQRNLGHLRAKLAPVIPMVPAGVNASCQAPHAEPHCPLAESLGQLLAQAYAIDSEIRETLASVQV